MKLKHLESALQQVEAFSEPKYALEQYPTSAHLAAQMAFTIQGSFGDIEGKTVADLGAGCGMLTIATALLGAARNVAYELDTDALEVAQRNFAAFELDEHVELVRANVTRLYDDLELPAKVETASAASSSRRGGGARRGGRRGRGKGGRRRKEKKPVYEDEELGDHSELRPSELVDTVLMNPPFGTRVAGVDLVFLQVAFRMARGAVYSLHKTSTRAHVLKKAEEWGAKPQVLAELRFDIPKMYKFHRKDSVDVEVDFIRFDVSALHGDEERGASLDGGEVLHREMELDGVKEEMVDEED